MLKFLILYDEELNALGLKSLLTLIDSSASILTSSIKNEFNSILTKNNFDIIFIVKDKNENITEIFDKINEYNHNTKLALIVSKPNISNLKLFKKYNINALIDKSYDVNKIINIINLIISNNQYIPPELSLLDIPHLTHRETKILTMVSQGLSNKQIAYDLNIAEITVKVHITHILRKLKCYNRVMAIQKGIEYGLIG